MPFRLSKIPRNLVSMFSRNFKAPLFIGTNLEMKINYFNQVTLSKQHNDILGNPIARLIFNFSEEDLKLLHRNRECIRNIFQKVGATGIYESEMALVPTSSGHFPNGR